MVNLSALDMFMDSLEEGVLFLNRDRQVVAINAAAEAMLGQERGEIRGRLCPSVFTGNPCATTCAECGSCSLAPGTGANRKDQDITFNQPDGRTIFLKMWALLLPPEDRSSSAPSCCATALARWNSSK
jgi:PAS domain-containing protein